MNLVTFEGSRYVNRKELNLLIKALREYRPGSEDEERLKKRLLDKLKPKTPKRVEKVLKALESVDLST